MATNPSTKVRNLQAEIKSALGEAEGTRERELEISHDVLEDWIWRLESIRWDCLHLENDGTVPENWEEFSQC